MPQKGVRGCGRTGGGAGGRFGRRNAAAHRRVTIAACIFLFVSSGRYMKTMFGLECAKVTRRNVGIEPPEARWSQQVRKQQSRRGVGGTPQPCL